MANTTTLDRDTKFLAEMIQELKTIKSETARRDILNIAKGIVIGETPRKETAENDALSSQERKPQAARKSSARGRQTAHRKAKTGGDKK